MSSDARINASRENGKLGGPKSDRGRARSAANSTKFGFYSQKPPVLSTESQEFYDNYRAEIFACHQPINKQEEAIVQLLVNTLWRIDRYEAAQEYFIDNEVMAQAGGLEANNPGGIPGDLRMSLALHHVLSAEHGAFRELNRIIARHHRTQQRLLSQLKDLQGPRFNSGVKPQPEPEENSENEPRNAAESTPPVLPVIPVLCRINPDDRHWQAPAPADVLKTIHSAGPLPPEKTMAA